MSQALNNIRTEREQRSMHSTEWICAAGGMGVVTSPLCSLGVAEKMAKPSLWGEAQRNVAKPLSGHQVWSVDNAG